MRFCLTLYCALVVNCILVAQEHITNGINKLMPKPIPAAPNVASLGKYGDYQVNLFNGLPDITIPIFEAKSGSLSLPITLKYHASGHKPTDVASWVGLGWSIEAGGQVSGMVRGKPDGVDYYYGSLNTNLSVCGPPGTGTYYYLKDLANGWKDGEPDLFSYAFPGGGGKFIVKNGTSPILIPHSGVKVATPNGLSHFELTDEQGILYRFGKNSQNQYATDGTTAYHGGNGTSSTSAWHLMEMNAPNSDDQIKISYQNLGTSSTHDISYVYTLIDLCDASNGATCPLPFNYQPELKNLDTNSTQKGISLIEFEGGKVEFIMGPQRLDLPTILNRLSQIKIYSKQANGFRLEKTVNFIFSYFTNSIGGNQALKLDRIEMLGSDNSVVQKYSFEYFTNQFSWNPSQSAFLNARDLWGYYNGATQNTDLVLPTTVPYQQLYNSTSQNITFGGGINRAVNATYAKEGVLKKITYPTGGYTEFDFESNRYDKDGVSTLVGGLRVIKISSVAQSGADPIVKTYRYGQGQSGYGRPNFLDTDFNYFGMQSYSSDCEGIYPILKYRVRTYFSNSSFEGDSPILYPYVTEYLGDPSGATLGRTEYIFDNGIPSNDVNHVLPGTTKSFKNSYSWARGHLTSKKVFSSTGGIISETQQTYTTLNQSNNLVGIGAHLNIAGNNWCTGNICFNEANEPVNGATFLFTTFYQNTGRKVRNTVSDFLYENENVNTYVQNSSTFSYDPTFGQVVQETSSTSKSNETEIKKYRYPTTYTYSGSETGRALALRKLKEKNILASPIETISLKQASGLSSVIAAQATKFQTNPANPNLVVPEQIWVWETTQIVPENNFLVSNISASDLVLDPGYKNRIGLFFDGDGNLLQAMESANIANAYQYGIENSVPIAEVVNATNTRYQLTVQGTSSSAVTIGGMTPVSSSRTFTVGYSGPVYLKMGISGNPGFTTYVDYSGSLGSGTITLTNGQSCGYDQKVFNNIGPGTYTINITVRASTGGVSVGACGQIEFPAFVTSTNGTKEFFFEDFEEGSATGTATPHTGHKYHLGAYTTTFIKPNARNYTIEYWYLSGSVWTYASAPYVNGMVLNMGSAIDNVRIYPTDAQMKNYTYNPIVGITTVINENGLIHFYEYDSFGRLAQIRDNKGHILKQYSYNYKTN
ncbi:MAG TPA: hypothetical protein PLM56_12885 [Cyclobacteriaceae bacterium]|nr:hypothetical protein [Cyclobacteriaceae bacterium]HRF34392.1 hypothetical protein [Cyclobacteriaceae bacterium]